MDIFLNFDFSILDFIAEHIRCAFLDPIMWFFSVFADKGLGWIALGLIFLIPKKTRAAGAASLVALLIGLLLGEFAIKVIVCRLRPYEVYESFHGYPMPFELNMGPAHGFSFPSGHTSASFAAAVTYFLINKKVGIITLIGAFLVGFSRLYNYVHYPTDVIAGAILGTLCALLVIFVFKKFSFDDKLRRLGKKN